MNVFYIMSIASEDNIELLRNLLKNHPLLISNPREFHFVFKKELERLHTNRFHYKSNLMVMNKELLKTFTDIKAEMMREHQEIRKQATQRLRKPREVHPNNNENVSLKIFEKSLEEKQRDFESLINKEKPKEIDFTDKASESSVTQNDYDFNMSQREAELAKIMQGQQKNKSVEAWLKGETNTKPDNINIKIDHSSNVKLDTISLNKEKRVRFKDDQKQQDTGTDFFSKLKLKETEKQDNITPLLSQILDNQTMILEFLKTISSRFEKND